MWRQGWRGRTWQGVLVRLPSKVQYTCLCTLVGFENAWLVEHSLDHFSALLRIHMEDCTHVHDWIYMYVYAFTYVLLHCLQTPAEETQPSAKGKSKPQPKTAPPPQDKGKGKRVLLAHASPPGNTVALHYLDVYTTYMYMYMYMLNHVPITQLHIYMFHMISHQTQGDYSLTEHKPQETLGHQWTLRLAPPPPPPAAV